MIANYISNFPSDFQTPFPFSIMSGYLITILDGAQRPLTHGRTSYDFPFNRRSVGFPIDETEAGIA